MTRRLRSQRRDDRGIYSVLYALLVVVLVGMAALVVDLSVLREERRMSRLAADAAVTAAGVYLNELSGFRPKTACEEAWAFAATNVGLTTVPPSPCDPGVFVEPFSMCPSTANEVSNSMGEYTVRITWPVPDAHPLMTNPTVQGNVTQAINPDPLVDGDTAAEPNTPCTRIGVTIERQHPNMFGAILMVDPQRVISSSVARGLPKLSNPPSIAALNVLEEHECDVVETSGQGFIEIHAVPTPLGPVPGQINVESDGRPSGSGSTCANSEPFVINPTDNPNSYIRANGLMSDGITQDPGKGRIRAFARNIAEGGNDAQSYDRTLGAGVLTPAPTILPGTSGAVPVTERYGDTATAATPIYNLGSSFGGSGAPSVYGGAQAPYNDPLAQPFVTLPNASYPDFKCTMGSPAQVVIPVGNWYVNCPPSGPNNIGLEVSNTLIFQGGNIVVEGGVQTKSFGCFVVNVTTTTCPTTTNPTPTDPPPTGDSILYLRKGKFLKGAQSKMFLPQTFTFIKDGNIEMGAGDGILSWTRPKALDCATALDPTACKYKRFGGLVLWSESASEHALGGQAGLNLVGVLFTPNTRFLYTGQPTQNQTQAQFWTNEIEVKGQSGLIMAPDPEDAIPSKTGGVALIR